MTSNQNIGFAQPHHFEGNDFRKTKNEG